MIVIFFMMIDKEVFNFCYVILQQLGLLGY